MVDYKTIERGTFLGSVDKIEGKGLKLIRIFQDRSTVYDNMIIGIRDERLYMKWLGTIISKQNIGNFISDALSSSIDPCGEYGEYHSLVVGLNVLRIRLKRTPNIIKRRDGIKYVKLQKSIVNEIKKDT